MKVLIYVGIGEAFDRLTILLIKLDNITEPKKLQNIQKEYNRLKQAVISIDKEYENSKHYHDLLSINRELWDIENSMRRYEKMNYFGIDFIETARKVYKKNDIRAKIKRVINRHYNSDIIEEKSHETCK